MDEEKCVKKNVAKKVKCGIVAGIFICLICNASNLGCYNSKKYYKKCYCSRVGLYQKIRWYILLIKV